MIDKRYDRRRARDLIDGPANALDALSGSPRSRKLGSEFDAASSRLRPGASGKRVAQPMKSRGADDTGARTLGIGSLGNQRAGRDAMDDQISYPPHEDVRLDDAAVRVISTGRVVALDGLSQVTAQAVFKRAEVQFRYCYEAAIERNPNARGRVKLSVDVSLSGAVDGAAIEESGLRDSRAEACILRVAERLRFPRSSNESQVSYLWIFVRGS